MTEPDTQSTTAAVKAAQQSLTPDGPVHFVRWIARNGTARTTAHARWESACSHLRWLRAHGKTAALFVAHSPVWLVSEPEAGDADQSTPIPRPLDARRHPETTQPMSGPHEKENGQ